MPRAARTGTPARRTPDPTKRNGTPVSRLEIDHCSVRTNHLGIAPVSVYRFIQWIQLEVNILSSIQSEDIYLELLETFAPSAEYLQSDSDARAVMAEAAVIASISLALSTFFRTYMSAMGTAAGEATIAGIRSLFDRSVNEKSRAPLLEALYLMQPFLGQIEKLSEAQRSIILSAVSKELERQGFPKKISSETSLSVMSVLRKKA